MNPWPWILTLLVACAPAQSTRSPLSPARSWHDGLQLALSGLDADLERLDEAVAGLPDDATPQARLALLAEREARAEDVWTEVMPTVPEHAVSYAERLLSRRLFLARTTNVGALRPLLEDVGWFTITEFGALADRRAWSVVQHADHDLDFQREVLVVLEGLAEIGQTDPVHVAYLTDRVAVAEGRPQTYGTQGACRGGAWRPDPIDAPETVDERRAAVGLPSLEVQLRQASARCR